MNALNKEYLFCPEEILHQPLMANSHKQQKKRQSSVKDILKGIEMSLQLWESGRGRRCSASQVNLEGECRMTTYGLTLSTSSMSSLLF